MRDKHRIARLLRDIDEIKAAVQRNSPVLREIVSARYYWLHVVAFGVAVIIFSVVMHFLVRGYRGYAAIPGAVRTVFWVIAAVVSVSIYAYRVRGVLQTVRDIDPRLTLWSLLGDHSIGEFMHVYGPLCLVAAALSVYLSHLGLGFFLVAVWAGWFGLTLNLLGFAVHMPEFYVGGYWMLVTGALSILVPGISASLWIAICFGGGSIAYAIVSEVIRRRGGLRGDE